MPARSATTVPAAPEQSGMRARLLTIQFWTGVALAPVAALLLLIGGTAVAAALAIVAVVVVAVAALLRREPVQERVALQQTLFAEIGTLREDVRADITTAARATHRALSTKINGLQESVGAMQRDVDAAQALAVTAREAAERRNEFPMPPPRRPPAAGSAGAAGVVRHTETVVTRSTFVDEPSYGVASPAAGYGAGRSRVYDGTASDVGRDSRDQGWVAGVGHDDSGSSDRGNRDRGDDRHRDSRDDGRRSDPDDRDSRADGPGWRGYEARDYEARDYGARDYGARDGNRGWHDFDARSSDRRALPAERDGESADDRRWSAMRGADRWAEVRQDDRGRELRMAERREERRVDETGSQMRIIDRWASVREERVDHDDAVRGWRTGVGHDGRDGRRSDRYDIDRHNRDDDVDEAHQGWRDSDRDDRDRRDRDRDNRDRDRDNRDRDERDGTGRLPRADASLPVPRPRSAADDLDLDRFTDADDGWRDVRSGTIEQADRRRDAASSGRPTSRDERDDDDWALSRLREIQRREMVDGHRDFRDARGDARDDGRGDGRDGRDDRRDNHHRSSDERRDLRDDRRDRRDDREPRAGRGDDRDFRDRGYNRDNREDRRDARDDRRDSGPRPPVREPHDSGQRAGWIARDRHTADPRSRPNGTGARAVRDEPREPPDEGRWVREPGQRGGAVAPRVDFDDSDDRWR
ncbi:MAG TPA: hypothetical protein VKB59_02890 [Micromonosporaceae bacterium]|nr:hypothetical protein [Micromonosporaceae bacterium]